MILKLKQTPGIFITGFMASGKSTIGRMLAERIGWQFIDLDREIETSEQTTISEIFAKHGEAEFRRIESEALRWRVNRIRAGAAAVVALGGGTFTQEVNREMIEGHGVSIWLDCPFPIVERRVAKHGHRPLALDPAEFRERFESRQAVYRHASYRVSVEHEDEQHTLRDILALPVFAP